jgi:hypothetical protein
VERSPDREGAEERGPGDTIRIRQTWIPDSDNFCHELERVFAKHRNELNVQILLMDPGIEGDDVMDLLGARMLLHRAPRESARANILRTASELNDLAQRVNDTRAARRKKNDGGGQGLEYGFYRSMPFGPLYQFRRKMFVGFYMSCAGGNKAPMLVITPKSDVWDELAKEFTQNWQSRVLPPKKRRERTTTPPLASDAE